MAPPNIFHMCMVYSVAELAQKFNVANSLISEMGRVVVKAEPAVIFNRFHRPGRRRDVKRYFGRVHFEREVHIELVENIQDWPEPFAEVVKPLLNEILACRRKG